jgi:hypothetical protein
MENKDLFFVQNKCTGCNFFKETNLKSYSKAQICEHVDKIVAEYLQKEHMYDQASDELIFTVLVSLANSVKVNMIIQTVNTGHPFL